MTLPKRNSALSRSFAAVDGEFYAADEVGI